MEKISLDEYKSRIHYILSLNEDFKIFEAKLKLDRENERIKAESLYKIQKENEGSKKILQ